MMSHLMAEDVINVSGGFAKDRAEMKLAVVGDWFENIFE